MIDILFFLFTLAVATSAIIYFPFYIRDARAARKAVNNIKAITEETVHIEKNKTRVMKKLVENHQHTLEELRKFK